MLKLFSVSASPFDDFNGPSKSDFVNIAEKTVAALNEGASLVALGISEQRAEQLVERAATVGRYLALVARPSFSW